MYCPKCQKNDTSGKVFCGDCGSRLLDNENKESNVIIEKSSGSKVLDDESMIEEYVGGNYAKIRGSQFSLPFLLFGPFYAIYRKMYLFSIIYVFVSLVLLYFVPGLMVLPTVVAIVLAFNFNSIYLSFVTNKVREIRKNAGSSERGEVLKLCRQLGGVSILPCLLLYLIVVCFSCIVLYPKYYDIVSKYGLFSNINDNKELYNELNYNNPTDMNSLTTSSGDLVYAFNTEDDSCEYSITIIDSKLSARNYLNNKTVYTGKDTKESIEEKTINNSTWEFMKVKTMSGTDVYDYAINYNHKTYNVVFKIYKDSSKCMKNKDTLIESLKFKEY